MSGIRHGMRTSRRHASPRIVIFALLTLTLLPACVTVQQDAYRNDSEEGVTLAVTSGREFGSRYVRVEKIRGPWRGTLAGGNTMYDARRDALLKYARREAARVCGDMGYAFNGEPSYEMIDETANHWTSRQTRDVGVAAAGGGLIAVLVTEMIAAANSPAENLPAALHQQFTCKDEIGKDGELRKRSG